MLYLTFDQLSLSRTNPSDCQYNETSPYFDLSPLYGLSEEDANRVRIKDGRGKLSPDCFFEDRLTFLPPAVSVLLILWNRNHNVGPFIINARDSILILFGISTLHIVFCFSTKVENGNSHRVMMLMMTTTT